MSLSDAGMCKCENGHTICIDHLEEDIDFKEYLNITLKSLIGDYKEFVKRHPDDSYYIRSLHNYESDFDRLGKIDDQDELKDLAQSYEFFDSIPAKYCLLCTFQDITADDTESYLLKKFELSKRDVINEVKSKFKDYESFKNYIKGEDK